MKKLSFLLACLLGLFALYESNPKYKGPFVGHVARQAQTACCVDLSSSVASTCEWLRPVARPVLHGFFYLYADKPKDYLLFTIYAIRLPTHTVYGIGIAGQFFNWNESFAQVSSCDILHSSLPSDSQRLLIPVHSDSIG